MSIKLDTANINTYLLVVCIWEDIVASDSAWRTLDEAINWVDTEAGLVYQTGFMLEKNDEYLILMDSFFTEGDIVGTMTRIPIETVRYIKKIPLPDVLKKGT